MLAIVFAAFLLLWLPYSVYFLVDWFDNRGAAAPPGTVSKTPAEEHYATALNYHIYFWMYFLAMSFSVIIWKIIYIKLKC
jgi:hypothetical protein